MRLLQKAKSNSFFSNSVFIFLIRFFPSLANVLVLILLSRNLKTDLYGHYQYFWIQLNLLLPIACMGIHLLMVTYSPAYVLQIMARLKKQYLLFYFAAIISLGTLFSQLQANQNQLPFWIPCSFLLCYTLSTILESFIVLFRSYGNILLANFTFSLFFVLIHYYFLFHNFNIPLLFSYLLIITVLRLLFYIGISIKKAKGIQVSTNDVPEIKKTLVFWLHLGVYDILQIAYSWLDKFIISLLLTASLSAIYFNGSMQIPFLPILLSAAGSAALIELATRNAINENEKIIALVNHSSRLMSSIVFPAFFFLLLYRHELFTLFLTHKYDAAVPVFTVSLFLLPLRAYNFTTILQNKHKGAIINIGALGDIVLSVLFLYPFYKAFGLPGVALSFVFSTYLLAAFYIYHAAKTLQVKFTSIVPFKSLAAKLIVFAVLYIGIYYATVPFCSAIFTLISGFVITSLTIGLALRSDFKKQHSYDGIKTSQD